MINTLWQSNKIITCSSDSVAYTTITRHNIIIVPVKLAIDYCEILDQ